MQSLAPAFEVADFEYRVFTALRRDESSAAFAFDFQPQRLADWQRLRRRQTIRAEVTGVSDGDIYRGAALGMGFCFGGERDARHERGDTQERLALRADDRIDH